MGFLDAFIQNLTNEATGFVGTRHALQQQEEERRRQAEQDALRKAIAESQIRASDALAEERSRPVVREPDAYQRRLAAVNQAIETGAYAPKQGESPEIIAATSESFNRWAQGQQPQQLDQATEARLKSLESVQLPPGVDRLSVAADPVLYRTVVFPGTDRPRIGEVENEAQRVGLGLLVEAGANLGKPPTNEHYRMAVQKGVDAGLTLERAQDVVTQSLSLFPRTAGALEAWLEAQGFGGAGTGAGAGDDEPLTDEEAAALAAELGGPTTPPPGPPPFQGGRGPVPFQPSSFSGLEVDIAGAADRLPSPPDLPGGPPEPEPQGSGFFTGGAPGVNPFLGTNALDRLREAESDPDLLLPRDTVPNTRRRNEAEARLRKARARAGR